jgi:hypothetical protein
MPGRDPMQPISHYPPAPERQRTAIFVTGMGTGRSGKTTLCARLLNPQLHYVSTDYLLGSLPKWCHHPGLLAFCATLADPGTSLLAIGEYVNDYCVAEVPDYFFARILQAAPPDTVVLVDGNLFHWPWVWDRMVELCRGQGWRAWRLVRGI